MTEVTLGKLGVTVVVTLDGEPVTDAGKAAIVTDGTYGNVVTMEINEAVSPQAIAMEIARLQKKGMV